MKTTMLTASILLTTAVLWANTPNREIRPISGDWEQVITTTNPGTRSEGIQSRLRYRGRDIAAWFDSLVIGSLRFEHVAGVQIWDFDGYDRVGRAAGDTIDPVPVSPAELDRGWYEASPTMRKQGTPEHWIRASRDDLKLILDPDRLGEIAAHHRLTPIVSGGGMLLEPMR